MWCEVSAMKKLERVALVKSSWCIPEQISSAMYHIRCGGTFAGATLS